MTENVFATVVTATAIVGGSLIGSIFSYYISKGVASKSIKEQYKMQVRDINYKEKEKTIEKYTYANAIRLDICTAIYQSIRILQNKEDMSYPYILPINKEYQKAVSVLCNNRNLKEISYIYQLYGIIEKVNREVFEWRYGDDIATENIQKGFLDIIKKIYGENYIKILNTDIDNVTYEDLYKNDLIKAGYKEVLNMLEELCSIESY